MQEVSGSVDHWDDDKGYGFIRTAQGQRVFFHISSMRGDARPQLGEPVLFLLETDDKGRARAQHVRHAKLALDRAAIRRKPRPASAPTVSPEPASRAKVKPARRPSAVREGAVPWAWLALLLVLPALGILKAVASGLGLWLLLGMALASLLALMFYASDKKKARKGDWRVPENTLQLISLLGGWPGALVAQQVFRHKTKMASFQTLFWLIVACHQLAWLDYAFFDGRLVLDLIQAAVAA